MYFSCRRNLHILFFVLLPMLTMIIGCGPVSLQPDLAGLVPGLTLEDLDAIQNDERLTADQRRAQIRQAIGAPETASGDRLVNFLLNVNVP